MLGSKPVFCYRVCDQQGESNPTEDLRQEEKGAFENYTVILFIYFDKQIDTKVGEKSPGGKNGTDQYTPKLIFSNSCCIL